MKISFFDCNFFDLIAILAAFLLHGLNGVDPTFVLSHDDLLIAASFRRIGGSALLFLQISRTCIINLSLLRANALHLHPYALRNIDLDVVNCDL